MNSDSSSTPVTTLAQPTGTQPTDTQSTDTQSTDTQSTNAQSPGAQSTNDNGAAVPQVRLKGDDGRLLLLLPPESDAPSATNWSDIWLQLKSRLNAGERFWQPNTSVHLMARDRLLDTRQLQDIVEALTDANLQLKRVYTSRRQTAVAAATAGLSVEQQSLVPHLNRSGTEGQALAEPLYVQTTVRSGMEIRHPGTVVVLGDVNPGSSIVADGDVLVWGALRGVVQAGATGNTRCMIMALRMDPTQIRIADCVARAPENPPSQYYPEVAYILSGSIRITKAAEFSRDRHFP